MKAYIYHIVNKINNKVYVGKSINFNHRKECHLSDLRLGKHHSHKLQRAYDKYGEENFFFEVREVECESDEELNKLEILEIQKYDSYNSGYNETLGGDGNAKSISFKDSVLIYNIAKHYSGINRQIARYFNCDHTVIDNLVKNPIFENEEYSQADYDELVKKVGLSDDNLNENYVKHNDRKLSEEQCLEILAVITNRTGYDKIMCSIMGVTNPTTTRLKKGIIYKEYIEKYNQLTREEQQNLCKQVFEKYNLEDKKAQRARASTKNALTQEQVNYILDNKDKKTRVAIGKDLGISADRVGSVILGKSYKDLVANYYK